MTLKFEFSSPLTALDSCVIVHWFVNLFLTSCNWRCSRFLSFFFSFFFFFFWLSRRCHLGTGHCNEDSLFRTMIPEDRLHPPAQHYFIETESVVNRESSAGGQCTFPPESIYCLLFHGKHLLVPHRRFEASRLVLLCF